jgi:hypothetical protein
MATVKVIPECRVGFIHIMKAAGQSVERMMETACNAESPPLSTKIYLAVSSVSLVRPQVVGEPLERADFVCRLGDYRFCAMTRNPLDRFLSAYDMFCGGGRLKVRNGAEHLVKPPFPGMTIDAVIDVLFDPGVQFVYHPRSLEGLKMHMLPMSHPEFFMDLAQLVVRYEDIPVSFERLFSFMGLPTPPVIRTNFAVKRPGLECLSDKHVRRLREYYAEDFRRFNYE